MRKFHYIIPLFIIMYLFAVAGYAEENNSPDVHKETEPAQIRDVIQFFDDVQDDAELQTTDANLPTEYEKRKIALLPFDNVSNNIAALDIIMPLLAGQLEKRGLEILHYEKVESFLCERRIRQASYISREVAQELGTTRSVNTIMAGAVLTFVSDGNPKIGIMARLIDIPTGLIVWSDYVSLTGEDFTKVLGLGTIKSVDKLIPEAINSLFSSLDNVSSDTTGEKTYKIAVLPFKNESGYRHAGMIINYLFQHELSNNLMFKPVDFGDVRKIMIDLRVGHKGEVDYVNLKSLSRALGVDVVLTGTVEEYVIGRDDSSPPRVTISARLLDSQRSRIIWFDHHQLAGDQHIIALDWGRLRSADKVADTLIAGLVENMETEGMPLYRARLSPADNIADATVSGLIQDVDAEILPQ
ncbi:MAG: hypothetical protein JSW20_05295 [Nitrospiraceae bacterium]|nr:MAG: hypothetical protein JSW20_05295 [Nitrospiraceae bacterium]